MNLTIAPRYLTAQANRTESKPQVVRCPYFCPLFLSAAANQPPVAFSAANGVLPSFIHSLMTSNNSTTFIEHLYILTLMDISFCAGLFRSLKDHHARGGSRKLKRARSRWRSHIVCGGKPFLKIPYDASSENSVIYTRRRFTYEWCLL